MCATVFALSILLDVWGLVLGAAVTWLYSVHKYRRSLNGDDDAENVRRAGKKDLSVGPGYMTARSWSVDSDLEEEEGDEAKPVNMDDIENNNSIFQPNATYESPRRPARSHDPHQKQEEAKQQWANQYSPEEDEYYYAGGGGGEVGPAPLVFLDAFSFSPDDFEYLWGTLPPLVGFDCWVSYVPSVAEVTTHLQSTCFFIIASGTQGQVSRVYACARGQDAKGRDISFLAEITFDSQQYTMGTTFKCDDVERINDFMAMLSLREIVGEYTTIPDGPHTINAY